MWNCIELSLICILIMLYLQTTWILLINFLYFSIPWLIWSAIIFLLIIKFSIRVPPPSDEKIEKVLGVDPLNFLFTENGVIQAETVKDDQFCMRIVAHRGAGYDYPENSLTAFRSSREKNCDAIEFDVMLTKDNIPIVFHDSSIDRLTGLSGNIQEMTWDELKEYDISTNHPLKSKFEERENIALFEEVITETLESGQHMFIDLKASGSEIVKIILNMYKKYPDLYQKAAITSFNPITIYMIRRKDPNIVAGLAWRPYIFSYSKYDRLYGPHKLRYSNMFHNIFALMVDVIHDWSMERMTYYILGISFIILHRDLVSYESIRLWKKKGVRVLCWPVNAPTEKVHFGRNLRVTYLTDTLI